jgi:hypothetical protein
VSLNRRACCVALAFAAGAGAAAAAPSDAEQARIDRLIAAVEQNKSVRFVRNGNDYAGDDAATFLRRKLAYMGGNVKTVQDFIEQIASRSTTSGEIYKVRLADGREMPAGDFLRGELARIESLPKR